MKKTETKDAIVSFAKSLSSRPVKRRKTSQEPIKRQDLFVPMDRMKDLMGFRKAIEDGLLHCSLQVLNRMAHDRKIKAVKVPGIKEWQVLPEWIEDFNNRWAKNYREKARA